MSKYRKITINVSNDELNAFEDLCVVDFQGNEEKENKARKKSFRIWGRLVKEWDRPKARKNGA